jgi:hypothetical protein
VIAQAKTEWASDSTDDAIAGICGSDGETVRACPAAADGGACPTCVMRFFENRFTK